MSYWAVLIIPSIRWNTRPARWGKKVRDGIPSWALVPQSIKDLAVRYGYTGIIDEVCPRCGRREGEAVSPERIKELRKLYPGTFTYCGCE